MPLLLGCIADDVTGASDLADMLVQGGMSVVQTVGVPGDSFDLIEVDAVVVSLKTRSVAPREAVLQSLEALAWLKQRGACRFFFKYCSTFDSTDRGNIGPVASSLVRALDAEISVICPALPENGRTVYQGCLFVGDKLLSESGMENHPLNPMTDANLLRLFGRQSKDSVALIPYAVVAQGPNAIRERLEELKSQHYKFAVLDGISDDNLLASSAACADLPLITGSSGIAQGLPDVYRAQGLTHSKPQQQWKPNLSGFEAIISGSCSKRTLQQVAHFRAKNSAAYLIDTHKLSSPDEVLRETLLWADEHLPNGPVLIYSSARPASVQFLHDRLGRVAAGLLVEQTLASVAVGLVDLGVRRMIVAGGETSGAVLKALNIQALRIGPRIAPGIPWTESIGEIPLALAFKSGNFGEEDFFTVALEM